VVQAHVPSGRQVPGAVEFFDRLAQSDLPAPVRLPIREALTVLLEDDGETKTPDAASFGAPLRFLGQHRDLAPPSIGVSATGCFTAGWQDSALRFTLEFLSAGYVRWVRVEDVAGKKHFDGGVTFADQVSLPARMPTNVAA
jgi:hypothetical protein